MAVSSVLLQATLCPSPQGTLLFHKPAAVSLAYHLNRKENKILPPHIFCFVFVQGYEIVRVLNVIPRLPCLYLIALWS